MTAAGLSVRAVRKSYGTIVAVDDVSLEIAAGETFGLLGPNGAGKSTMMAMLCGVLVPDAGGVAIADESGVVRDPRDPAGRRLVGVAPQSLALYEELSAEENLTFFGRLQGLSGTTLRERVASGLALAGLEERRKDRAGTFSGGMLRRLNLAAAVLHQPRVLLLDEPTAGVDPQSRAHLFESIEALAKGGTTLVYTTHQMEEAERLCDRVAIMDRGRILACDTVAELVRTHAGTSNVTLEVDLENGPPRSLQVPESGVLDALRSLEAEGQRHRAFSVRRPDLETVFLHLTGRRLRDAA